MIDPATLDMLERLDKEATKGPWNAARRVSLPAKSFDLQLIAAMRNALPALLADARRLAQIAELWPRLNPWNQSGAGMELDAFRELQALLTAPPTDAQETKKV